MIKQDNRKDTVEEDIVKFTMDADSEGVVLEKLRPLYNAKLMINKLLDFNKTPQSNDFNKENDSNLKSNSKYSKNQSALGVKNDQMKYTNNDVINYLQSVKLKILHVQSLRDRKQQLLTALADSYLTLLNDYSRVVSQLMSFLSCNSNQLQIENKLEYFKLLLSTISLKLNSLLASTNLALTKDQVYSQLLDCRCEMENAINLAQNLLTPLNKQLLQYDNLGYEFQQIVGQYTKLSNDLNMLEKDISRLTLS